MLEDEFKYYKEHQKELAAKFHGKYLLIHNQGVVGNYDSELAAYTDAKKRALQPGSFLIQHCLLAKEEEPQVFHSRVAF